MANELPILLCPGAKVGSRFVTPYECKRFWQ